MDDVTVGCKPLSIDLAKGGEFYTVVHNPSSLAFQELVRIELPNEFFEAEVYDATNQ